MLPQPAADELRAGVHDLLASLFPDVGPGADSRALETLKAAAHGFVEPALSPADRRRRLAAAAGDPLTDAVLEVVVDLASLVPAGALERGVDHLGKAVGEQQERMATKWYAPFVPSEGGMASLGGDLEKLRARMHEPGFRDELSRALDVVRVLGRLEAHNLEKIVLDVDAAGAPEVKQAFARFAATVADGVAAASLPGDDPAGALARDLVSLGSLRLRAAAGEARPGDEASFAAVVERLTSGASASAAANAPGAALTDAGAAARALPKTLDDARDRLLADLTRTGALSDEARGGLLDMCADLSAVVVTAAHLFRLFGAAQNDKIPEAERIDLVKNAAKDAGPVVVKLLQTFANQARADGPGAVDDVTLRALVELQEHVPEMSEAEVRAQIEQGLGMKLEEAFTWFDPTPLASASIGQVHRARVKLRFGREREVVVKVQRPGLDAEFERATRVSRLGLQFVSELVGSLAAQGKTPFGLDKNGIDPVKMMKLVEETVSSFVESFQVETDFDKERNNLKQFRRDMQSHGHVTAPYVFRQRSCKTVLTMEYMRLEKITSLLERAEVARETKKKPAPTGPLPAPPADVEAEVKMRAVDHVARAFGIVASVDGAAVTRGKGGFTVSVGCDHPLFPSVVLSIADNGVIKHVQTPPILKDDRVKLVRDRFLASLLSQAVVHGRVHGDPHMGNWGLLADGETIVMLDFGKIIDLKKKHLAAPLSLAWHWFRKDAGGMADAVLTMTTSANGKKSPARAPLVEALTELQSSSGGRVEPDQIITTITATLAQHGLGLSPVYTQGIKAGFSFAGNFSVLSQVGAGDIDLQSWARAGRITGLDAVDSATLGVVGGVLSMRKNARVGALNQAPKS